MNNRIGLSRPGAVQMVGSVTVLVMTFIGLLMYPSASSGRHGRPLSEKDAESWLFMAVLLISFIMYLLGFFRYAIDKGYSRWFAFWLLLGQLYGFVTLFFLPDLNTGKDNG